MNGPDLLRHAAGVVDKRRSDYGEPEDASVTQPVVSAVLALRGT